MLHYDDLADIEVPSLQAFQSMILYGKTVRDSGIRRTKASLWPIHAGSIKEICRQVNGSSGG